MFDPLLDYAIENRWKLICFSLAVWISFDEALELLEFKSDREVVEKARQMIEARGKEKTSP